MIMTCECRIILQKVCTILVSYAGSQEGYACVETEDTSLYRPLSFVNLKLSKKNYLLKSGGGGKEMASSLEADIPI